MKALLLLSLAAITTSLSAVANTDSTVVVARESAGFSRYPNPQPVESCRFLRGEHEGTISLRLESDENAGVQFSFTEQLTLPLREGVIPTFQRGFDVTYEEGTLLVSFRGDERLRTERFRFSLEIDPWLREPKEFLGRRWVREGFPSPRESETERLYCAF